MKMTKTGKKLPEPDAQACAVLVSLLFKMDFEDFVRTFCFNSQRLLNSNIEILIIYDNSN